MRRSWLIFASVSCASAAFAQTAPTPIVVELRLGERSAEAMAWRDADGAISVETSALTSLGIRPRTNADAVLALSDIEGLSYHYDAAAAALILTCDSRCFPVRALRSTIEADAPEISVAPGGFLNADLAATSIGGQSDLAGAFDLGLFGPYGFGGASWTGDSRGRAFVRLETQWTIEAPSQRLRARFGDSFTRGGFTGVPTRFGGLQLATDFSLDPGFVPFPTPALSGETNTPSTLDLYVDGALRMRQRIDAGAFSIVDAPLLAGGGVAQIVVTDALGREQIYAQPFYTSPMMLRRGLSDYSFALGAERENFTRRSNDYGRGFASALYRYGFSNAFTGEARLETSDALSGLGVAGSTAAPGLGQVDLALAGSDGEHDGLMARASWQNSSPLVSFGVQLESASEHFQRIGERRTEPPPRLSGSASISSGQAALALTFADERETDDVHTLAFSYTPRLTRAGHLQFNALYVNSDDAYLSLGLGFYASFGDVSAGASAELDRGRSSARIAAQRAPEPDGGFGWRATHSAGAIERTDVALTHLGAAHEAELDLSRTEQESGVRLQYATGLAWIDKSLFLARPIRESFVLADVGAPGVLVLRDRRPIGVTDAHGRIIVTGLRPYETNRIGILLDDLPWDTPIGADEMEVTPAARSGAILRFARAHGVAGEVRVVDQYGSPLPAGALLVRQSDGARFPVGGQGRLYLTDVSGPERFVAASGCVVQVSAQQIGADLACEVPS